jgi:hypothetical protein
MAPTKLPGSISVLECQTLRYPSFFIVPGICKEICFERKRRENGRKGSTKEEGRKGDEEGKVE